MGEQAHLLDHVPDVPSQLGDGAQRDVLAVDLDRTG